MVNDGASVSGDGGRHADRRGVDHRPARHQARVKLKTRGSRPLPERNQISSVNIMNITLDASVAQAFQDVADAWRTAEAAERGACL